MMQLLDYAMALETHRNFARAAKQLGVSQPTLTRGIQELERHFGTKLFDRTRQGVFPTAPGKIVLHGARKISGCLDDLHKEIKAFHGVHRAELKLGVGPMVAQTWIPDAVISLLGEHPSVEIHVATYEWWELVPHLLNQNIEIAIGEIAPDITKHSEITVQKLPQRPVRFFCRTGHPLTKIGTPSLKQIGDYAMASAKLPLRASEHFGGTRALGKLSANGMYFEPQISCPTFDVCLRIIKSSDNIGIAPLAQLSRISANSDFAVIPFDAPSLRTNYGIMRLRDRSLSPGAAAFMEQALASENKYHGEEGPEAPRPGRKPRR
jgi:DNA-binding transcriptional LysR family regulator